MYSARESSMQLPFYLRERKQLSSQTNVSIPLSPFRPPTTATKTVAQAGETRLTTAARRDLQSVNSYRLFPSDPEIARQHPIWPAATTKQYQTSGLFPPGPADPNIPRFQLRRPDTFPPAQPPIGSGVPNSNNSVITYYDHPPQNMENGSNVKTWDCSDGMKINVATAHTRGHRNEMEDVFIEHKNVGNDALGTIYVFGVCDGHGGAAVSDWLQTNLGPTVTNSLRAGLSLQQAFAIVQSSLEKEIDPMSAAGMGATCCIAVILPKHNLYYIANAGDSRCVLVDHLELTNSSRRITVDHKPDEPGEKARIEKSGGSVMSMFGVSRINGCLSVSRGFGDCSLRQFGFTEQPDVFGPFVLQDHTPLILACDGLFDVITDAGVAKTALHFLSGSVSPITLEKSLISQRAVEQLRNVAFANDSRDNISVMLIVPWKKV